MAVSRRMTSHHRPASRPQVLYQRAHKIDLLSERVAATGHLINPKSATRTQPELGQNGQKAHIDPPRRNMGAFRDGAVRLAEPKDALGLAEGVEDALAAIQLVGVPCWACL